MSDFELHTLADLRHLVLQEIKSSLKDFPDLTRRTVSYHYGFTDESGQPFEESPGKLLRSTLTLLCAEAVGTSTHVALPQALAVEMVHNFSLLHDDIIDGDALRRGRPTAWKVFGERQALLTGDSILAAACRIVTSQPPPEQKIFYETLDELVEGQTLDIEFEMRPQVALDEYLDMAGKKTASLISCACAMGALTSGDEKRAAALRRFGHQLGLAFQITDDYLGTFGETQQTGKPVGADIAAQKKTYCAVLAHDQGVLPASRRFCSAEEVKGVVDAMRRARIDLLTMDTARSFWNEAVLCLKEAELPRSQEERLCSMLFQLLPWTRVLDGH